MIWSHITYCILKDVGFRRQSCHSCSFLLSLPPLLLSTLIARFATALWPNRLTAPQNLKKCKWIKEISFPVYIAFISHCQQLMSDQSFYYGSYYTLTFWRTCFNVALQSLQNEEAIKEVWIQAGAHALTQARAGPRGYSLASLTEWLANRQTHGSCLRPRETRRPLAYSSSPLL